MMLHQLLHDAITRKGLSYRMIQDRADWQISKSALTYLLDGRAIFIAPRSVAALSVALDVPEKRIRDAALESQRTRDELWRLAVAMDAESVESWMDAGRALAGDRRTA